MLSSYFGADLKHQRQPFCVKMVGLILTCKDISICNKVSFGRLGMLFLGCGWTVSFFQGQLCCPSFVIQETSRLRLHLASEAHEACLNFCMLHSLCWSHLPLLSNEPLKPNSVWFMVSMWSCVDSMTDCTLYSSNEFIRETFKQTYMKQNLECKFIILSCFPTYFNK